MHLVKDSPRTGSRIHPFPACALALAMLALALINSRGARAASLPGADAVARKLDRSLMPWSLAGPETITVWVGFADKGPGGPREQAARLAEAAAHLSQRSLERRARTGVWPRVDELDLPVAPEYIDALSAAGFRPFAASRWLNRVAVRVTPASLGTLARIDAVTSISPVARGRREPERISDGSAAIGPSGLTPPDTRSLAAARGLQAAPPAGLTAGQLAQVGATALHDAGFTGSGKLIAVLDQGFNFFWKHDALRDRVFAPGYLRDFVDGDATVADSTDTQSFRHGTWALGCLAGNLPGIYLGSAYGADFALARTEVAATERPVEMLYWAQAAEWADSLGVDLISSSVGYNLFDSGFPSYGPADFDGHTTDITRAAEIAASKGILVVNSVGNGGEGPLPRLAAPADMNGDSMIAVGAVDASGNVATFSSRGPTSDGRIKPDLVARGVGTWLVSANGLPSAYLQGDGTSFAAPLVAGLAACLMQARPDLAPTGIVRALRETASAMCLPDLNRGWGIPDGAAARNWTPGPPGFSRPPAGYLELFNVGGNPAHPAAVPVRLRFGLGPRFKDASVARLRVFDASGRAVRSLFHGSMTCGRWQSVDWNGRDEDGRAAEPGIYFVHFDAAGRIRTLRIALLP